MRNIVEKNADFVNHSTRFLQIEQDGIIVTELDLEAFANVVDMNRWEIACYSNSGVNRGIVTLDLLSEVFGKIFASAFYARKEKLGARQRIAEINDEMRELFAERRRQKMLAR